MTRILTIDVEEWFHLLDNESTKLPVSWKKFDIRIHANIERVFDILERTQTRATFFCLGWIAELYPNIIKEISERGYEVASHSNLHQLIYEQSPREFKADLERSIKTLEDITGKKVKCFRAPGFSIIEKTKWVFEILANTGITIDCSIFPAKRAHGGFPQYKYPTPAIINYNGIRIKELPVNFITFMGYPVIFTGGGYFRITPYNFIRKWSKQSRYIMSYMHPRDFDPDQPVIKDLPAIRKFKSYAGLNGAAAKLEKWITEFKFIDVASADKQINWNNVPVFHV